MSAIVCRPGAEDCFDISVFNCLTGCVKVLPPTLNTGDVDMQRSMLGCSLHMTLDDQDPSCYYVLITGCGYPRHFEVFESRSTCWKVVDNPYVPFKSGQVLRDFAATHLSSSELSVADADFWWFESVADFEESDEDGGEDHDDRHCSEDSLCCLLGYHARHDAWTSLLLPPTPCENVCRGLNLFMKYRGRLLLGEKLEDADGTILGFGVWEVQPNSVEAGTWVEVARTPEHLHPALNSRSWDCDLSADGGLFWMTFCNGSHRSFRPPLVFDMARNSWYSLPLTKTSRKFGCICVNRPSFSTSV
ncbi:hypothetical protein L7F22_065763 [Adiantum nelumboides]|nr:hypothetical protein [Adiantum nelumboides]